MTTLLGGEEIEVTHISLEALSEFDRKRLEQFQPLSGTTELVKVCQIMLSMMPRYRFAVLNADESMMIELYCGKERGWADTLTPKSLEALADRGLEINLPFFLAWLKRQAKWEKDLQPEWMTSLQTQMAELQTKLASVSTSSSSPSPVTTG